MEIRFDERGLVPVVIQDWASGEVLTLAYANSEAIDRTRETGELHLWSRSRDELWHKGATSGNVQKVRALRMDCDGDAVLALVEPAGPACHTGERTCFHNGEVDVRAPHEALPDLERTLSIASASVPTAPTRSSSSTTRRSSARRSGRRRRRSRAPPARRPTTASTRRPPTSCTT